MSFDFFGIIDSQRACRRFSADPVDEGDIDRMLESASHAPSAENSQPWVFVVVQNDDIRREIASLATQVWLNGRAYVEGTLAPNILRDVDEFVNGCFGNAPTLVVVCADLRRVSESLAASSIYPASQNLLLAANALGYGSIFTHFSVNCGEELQSILGLPSEISPYGIIAIGRPDGRLGIPRREPIGPKTHRDRFGTPWAPGEARPLE